MAKTKRVGRLTLAGLLRPLRFYAATVRIAGNGSTPFAVPMLLGLPLVLTEVLAMIFNILTSPLTGGWHVVAIAVLTLITEYLACTGLYLACREPGE